MKNLEKREGFKNRHIIRIPSKKMKIKIVINDFEGEHIMLCEWLPFNCEPILGDDNIKSNGYLGTAKVIDDTFNGIGFHAWENNDSEFIYYTEEL